MQRSRSAASGPRRTPEVTSGFWLAGFLGVVFCAFTLLAIGPMAKFDAYLYIDAAPQSWNDVLHVLDRIGQRAVCLPVLGLTAYLLARRHGSWRPGLVAAASVFSLNLLVLVLKVGLGRNSPHTGVPEFFSGGMAYPSGHSSNVILVYGLCVYLLLRYGTPGRKARVLMYAVLSLLCLLMVYTSMALRWHWFTDLVGGLLVGAMILQLTATVDRLVPRTRVWTRLEPVMMLCLARRPDWPARSQHPTRQAGNGRDSSSQPADDQPPPPTDPSTPQPAPTAPAPSSEPATTQQQTGQSRRPPARPGPEREPGPVSTQGR